MPRSPDRVAFPALLRAAGSAAILALLAACATRGPESNAPQQAAVYAAHARGNYVPPGPPDDPWGPYIEEASTRFDVPAPWVRALMRVESGGQEYRDGQLTTSPKGAMGLMQVMPATYEELRDRYGLGSDPFDPHDNIIAGVAYMRELYDIYGAPAFLAAYNGGPNRLDDYLSNQRSLPDETRHYVAMIGPALEGVYPRRRSPAEAYAMNDLPLDIRPGLRHGGRATVMVASATRHAPARRGAGRHAVEVARLTPRSEHGAGAAVTRVALLMPPPMPPGDPGRHSRGFHLIARAEAASAPVRATGGTWGIQVGAYASAAQAEHAAGAAKASAPGALGGSHSAVASVRQAHGLLWRARLTGLSHDSAVHACQKLAHGHGGCIVVSPESQS
ncbi:MAG TPA: lytic transglycosylase domain-containing protein [Acetobacteraceae bacterium]|nr:lytic transglycosylase domain-containing protein [Acetobacteraceae bacterium]